MVYLLYLIALPAIVLNYVSKWIFHLHGYAVTYYHRHVPGFFAGQTIPIELVDGKPVLDIYNPKTRGYEYAILRNKLLMEFIERNELDTLVIFGCSCGRELYPLAKTLDDDQAKVQVVGVDFSKDAIESCRSYGLRNAQFHTSDMEDKNEVLQVLNAIKGKRAGVYMSETAAYILPHKMKQFVDIIGTHANVVGFQLIEPAYIDWDINWRTQWGLGMVFSYQRNYWRHNYPRLMQRYFAIDKVYFLDPKLRGDAHLDQPLWFISSSKSVRQ
jgi:hypothetical protein